MNRQNVKQQKTCRKNNRLMLVSMLMKRFALVFVTHVNASAFLINPSSIAKMK